MAKPPTKLCLYDGIFSKTGVVFDSDQRLKLIRSFQSMTRNELIEICQCLFRTLSIMSRQPNAEKKHCYYSESVLHWYFANNIVTQEPIPYIELPEVDHDTCVNCKKIKRLLKCKCGKIRYCSDECIIEYLAKDSHAC